MAEAESRAKDLELANQELREAHQSLMKELGEAKHGIELGRKSSRELVAKIRACQEELSSMSQALELAEQEIAEHKLAREALLNQVTLDCYKAIEVNGRLGRLGLWDS